VRLARGHEVGLDANVQLLVADREPDAAARLELLWFRELAQAEQPAVEVARLGLGGRRSGDLDVIEGANQAASDCSPSLLSLTASTPPAAPILREITRLTPSAPMLTP
jgi:hypothetical protein